MPNNTSQLEYIKTTDNFSNKSSNKKAVRGFYLSYSILDQISSLSKETGFTKSEIVRQALKNYFEENKNVI